MTVGELRDRLAHYPDHLDVVAATGDTVFRVESVAAGVYNPAYSFNPSATFATSRPTQDSYTDEYYTSDEWDALCLSPEED